MTEFTTESQRAQRIAEGLWIVVVAVATAWIIFQGWDSTLDPITDTGRDFYIPEQIRAGAKLYRDILYYYPPLTPYLLAAITSVIGGGLASYQVIGTIIALLTAAAVYALARMAGNVHAAGAATLLFASGSIFSISGRTMNYLVPYAYASTLAMLFFLCGAAFLYRALQGRTIWIAPGVLMLFLAPWTKIEYALFSLILLLAVRIRWVAVFALAGVASVLLVDRYFADAPPDRHWLRENILAPSLLQGESARFFYRQVSGFDAPWPNLLAVLIGAAATVVLVLLVRLADRKRQSILTIGVALVMAASAFYGGVALVRGWALLQLVLLPFVIRRRDPLLIVVVVSLCASSRVILRLFPMWYGFVFVIPTLILIAVVLFEWLPRQNVYSRRAALLWIVPVTVISGHLLVTGTRLLAEKQFPVETVRGTFYDANRDRALVLNAFLDEMAKRDARSLVVIPEGLALNYLAGVPTSLTFYTFTPAETAVEDIERRIIREMEATPPELIAIVSRSVSDFGYRAFGVDYNRDLATHIRRRYTVEREWQLPGFELILLRRSGVLSSPP